MERLFATPAGPVAVTGAPDSLIEAFQAQAPDWPEGAGDPVAEIEAHRNADGLWRFHSPVYDVPDFAFPDGLVAGNGLIGCLIHSFVGLSPDWVCLHAGAVEMNGGLTVLLGDNLAGKSTLTAALMARGHRLWCDDRLPVVGRDGTFEGMSLGLRPKLRIPLPPNAPAPFRQFVEDRAGPVEEGMQYVIPQGDEATQFDHRAPLKRLILLDRRPDAPFSLSPAPLGETVKRLAGTTFAQHLDAIQLLGRLRALAEACEVLVMTYKDTFEAAKELDHT